MPHPITLDITELAGLGDGVGYADGRKVFVPYTVPGDKVTAVISKQTAQQSFAALQEVLVPGKDRITPACRHFYQCGGCSLQHVNEAAYLQFKKTVLEQAVSRAGYPPEVVAEPISIGAHTRRRAVFKIHKKQVGYYQPKSHTLVAVAQCPILEPGLEQLIAPLNTLLKNIKKAEILSEVALYQSDSGVDIVFTSAEANWDMSLYEQMTAFAEKQDIARISYRYKQVLSPVIQRRPVQMQAGDVTIDLPPGAFQQASKKGQGAITHEVVEALRGAKKVIDLYAGCGTYTFPIAGFAKVHAYEGSRDMVKTITQTAGKQKIAGISAEARDLVKQPVPASHLKNYDAAVINPPRNGAGTQVAELAKSGIARIVMVSCNPITFSEDARVLQAAGYALKKAIPIDQFTWSSHLELVAVFGSC